MTAGDPELLAQGRAADVYDLGDGTVLRRYRTAHDTASEAKVMAWARAAGLPVPEVHRSDGPELVMDLAPGPTMLEDLGAHPWRMVHHARLLADLSAQVGRVRAPEWLATPPDVPAGDALLHLDLHPMNVILSPEGPVLIDWTNAARGEADFDAAYSDVLMSTFEVAGWKDRLGRRLLLAAFRGRRGRRQIERHRRAACARRLADANVTPGERAALQRLLRRSAGRPG